MNGVEFLITYLSEKAAEDSVTTRVKVYRNMCLLLKTEEERDQLRNIADQLEEADRLARKASRQLALDLS